MLTRQRSLGDIRRDNNFSSAVWSRLEDFGLQISRHLRIDWQDSQWRRFIQLRQTLCQIIVYQHDDLVPVQFAHLLSRHT